MAVTTVPVAGRTIKAADIAEMFRDLLSNLNRVASGYGIITSTSSLNTTVQPGAAWVSGKKIGVDSDTNTTVPLTASETNRIYLKTDETFEVRTSGTPGDPANSIKLYTIVTSASGVANPSTDITDHRDDFAFEIPVSFRADDFIGRGSDSRVEVFSVAASGTQPWVELEDTSTGDIVRLWARSSKIQVTNQDGTTVYVDNLKDLILDFANITGIITDAQHGNRSGGSLHSAVTGSVAGFMSAADKTKLDGATSAATASKLMTRDASGRAKVAAPSATDDIARKAEVDAVQTNLTSHKAAGGAEHPAATTAVAGFMSATDKTKLDGATDAATASALMQRDAAGRVKIVDGSVASDAATKGQVDTVQSNLTSHIGTGGSSHAAATTGAAGFMSAADKTKLDGAVSAPTASKLMIRDASGRAQVATPSAAADIARKDTVDAVQTNLDTHAGSGGAAHAAATSGAAGFMSAADKTKLDAATSGPTVSTVMMRDAAGRAQVVAPAVAADIARKDTVDAVQTNLDAHAGSGGAAHAAATGGAAGFMSAADKTKLDGATSAATASALMQRDASGRAKVAAPSATDDIARKAEVDTVQTNLTSHKAAGGAEHPAATTVSAGFMSTTDKTKLDDATSAATASKLMQRDAAGRAKVAAPSASDDIARKDTVDTHANLTTAHSATSAATASRMVVRDASGRAQFADPSAAQDAATKNYVDTELSAAGKKEWFLTPGGATLPNTAFANLTKTQGTNLPFYELDFDASTAEAAYWFFHALDSGDLTVEIFWKAAATAGNVVWKVSTRGVDDASTWDSALGTTGTVTDAAKGTTEQVNKATITLTTPYTAGQWVQFKLERDAANVSDTMAGDAKVLGMRLSWA